MSCNERYVFHIFYDWYIKFDKISPQSLSHKPLLISPTIKNTKKTHTKKNILGKNRSHINKVARGKWNKIWAITYACVTYNCHKDNTRQNPPQRRLCVVTGDETIWSKNWVLLTSKLVLFTFICTIFLKIFNHAQ